MGCRQVTQRLSPSLNPSTRNTNPSDPYTTPQRRQSVVHSAPTLRASVRLSSVAYCTAAVSSLLPTSRPPHTTSTREAGRPADLDFFRLPDATPSQTHVPPISGYPPHRPILIVQTRAQRFIRPDIASHRRIVVRPADTTSIWGLSIQLPRLTILSSIPSRNFLILLFVVFEVQVKFVAGSSQTCARASCDDIDSQRACMTAKSRRPI